MANIEPSTAFRDKTILLIRSAGLVTVAVQDETDADKCRGLVFDGTLEEFLNTTF